MLSGLRALVNTGLIGGLDIGFNCPFWRWDKKDTTDGYRKGEKASS